VKCKLYEIIVDLPVPAMGRLGQARRLLWKGREALKVLSLGKK